MVKKLFAVGVIFLSCLLIVGCGIPKEDYDAAVAAKEEAEAKVASLESEVSSLRDQVSSLTNELATAEKTIGELKAAVAEGTVTPTPIAALSKDYSKYGFGFDYPRGFSITEMGLFDSEANDNSGIVKVGIENDEIQLFLVSWFRMTLSTWTMSGDLGKGLDDTFAGMMGEGVASIDRGELVETTKAGHEMVYQYYIATPTLGSKKYGIAGIFYCDECQKVFQLITLNSTISAKQDVLEDFVNYLDSFICH